ncbi:MAG: hypothetical protein R2705_15540 [Ilumatobacteraceae bacterium]
MNDLERELRDAHAARTPIHTFPPPSSEVVRVRAHALERRHRRNLAFATFATVAIGTVTLVGVLGNDDSVSTIGNAPDTVVQSTAVEPGPSVGESTSVVAPPSTTLPASTSLPTGTGSAPSSVAETPAPTSTGSEPTTTVPGTTGFATVPLPDVITVDHAAPPPLVTPQTVGTLTGSADTTMSFAVLDDDSGFVVVDGETATRYDGSGNTGTSVPAPGVVDAVVHADILYGLRFGTTMPPTAEFVAIPLSGSNAGTVVARSEVDPNQYLELPVGSFGLGRAGVVDLLRARGTTVIHYVDERGQQSPGIQVRGPDVPGYDEASGIITLSDGRTVRLDVRRHPDAADPFVGPSPMSYGPDGELVLWTWIGPGTDPSGDFGGSPTEQVVIRIGQDGRIDVRLLPIGWEVAATSPGGVLLQRTSVAGDGQRTVEMAWMPPAEWG